MVLPKQGRQATDAPLSRPGPGAWSLIAVCVFFWIISAATLQWRAGSLRLLNSGGHPDEAAHYVTGVMLRDYVAGGHFSSPRAFVEQYYAHYPKIGLFVWPPLFHGTEGNWGPSLQSFEDIGPAAGGAAHITSATSIYWVVRREYPAIVALVSGAAIRN